jgi:golgin subfamily B member 1
MKKPIYTLILILLVIGGCKSKQSGEQEIQKLLERQAVIKESQQESVDKLQQINDSLVNEKKILILERNKKDERSKLLEKDQQILIEKIKSEEQSELSSEKTGFEEQFSIYKDSIEQLKNELASIDVDIDSIEKSMDLFEMQEGQAEISLKSGIDEIDQRITKLENQKQQEIKKADLLKRRSTVAEKKIEAYQLERQMYVDQRDDLLQLNASEEQLQPYRQRIVEMDSTIKNEEANKKAIHDELFLTNQWISGVDKMINDLKEEIKKEYDRENIIEGFILSEKQRLQMEIANLQSSRERMVKEQDRITRDLARSEQQIASLDERMELIKNKDMSNILQQQAANEQSDAALAEEEIQLLEESTALDIQSLSTPSDMASDEFKSLVIMSNQLDSLRASIQEEKTEITKTRKELSEKRAEAAEKRDRTSSAMTTVVLIIVIVGLVLLTLFYYLGRKTRKS